MPTGCWVSRLSAILPSFPGVTGLSTPRTRSRNRTNMGEKMHLTEAHAPRLCLPPPPAICGLPWVPENAPLLWPQSSYIVPVQVPWGDQRNVGQSPIRLRPGRLAAPQSLGPGLCGKVLPFPGLLGRVQSQGLPAPPQVSVPRYSTWGRLLRSPCNAERWFWAV